MTGQMKMVLKVYHTIFVLVVSRISEERRRTALMLLSTTFWPVDFPVRISVCVHFVGSHQRVPSHYTFRLKLNR